MVARFVLGGSGHGCGLPGLGNRGGVPMIRLGWPHADSYEVLVEWPGGGTQVMARRTQLGLASLLVRLYLDPKVVAIARTQCSPRALTRSPSDQQRVD